MSIPAVVDNVVQPVDSSVDPFPVDFAILTSDNVNPLDADTVRIRNHTFTLRLILDSGGTVADQVLIGATADDTLQNIIYAVNGTGTPGTNYGTGTVTNADVSAFSSVVSHTIKL